MKKILILLLLIPMACLANPKSKETKSWLLKGITIGVTIISALKIADHRAYSKYKKLKKNEALNATPKQRNNVNHV